MSQTFRDFEWIVVDDGSVDDSLSVIQSFAQTSDFSVRVITQRNSGKHAAWNRAVQLAQGELFVPLDSDDECLPTALEVLERTWREIPRVERDQFSGVNVLCLDPETRDTVGSKFPTSPLDSNNLDLAYIHRTTGEKWGCIRTDLLRAYPFPASPLGYMPESYIWFQIARRYKVRCVNEALRLYYRDQSHHLASPHSGGKLTGVQNAFSYSTWHLSTNSDYLWRDPIEWSRTAINIWRLASHLKKSIPDVAREFGPQGVPIQLLALLPFGQALAALDRVRGRV